MGTRSLTRVISESGKTILTMYRQYDGYVEGGHGDELVKFLKGMVITNGIRVDSGRPEKSANGMGCLAAQLVAHFKNGVGGIYLEDDTIEDQEYNYRIELCGDELTLSYECYGEGPTFLLPDKSNCDTDELVVVEFLYPSKDGYENVWRKIRLIEQTNDYITGYDLNDQNKFKRFTVKKIVGGASKVFTVNK